MEKKFTPSLQSSSASSSSIQASSSSIQASSKTMQASSSSSSSSSGGPLKSNAPKFVPKIPVKKEVVAVTSGVENSR